eukprot:509742_1
MDLRTVCAVNGYIRESKQLLSHEMLNIIPSEITYIVILYTRKPSIVYGIGANYNGELGVGETEQYLSELTLLKWTEEIEIKNIFNGYEFTIFVDGNNECYSVGDNGFGACIQNKSKGNNIKTILKINALKDMNISKILCNPWSNHGFIITQNNSVYGFGRNEEGQLGIGNKNNMFEPTLVNVTDSNELIKDIQCAWDYSIALTNDGKVFGTDNYDLYGGNGLESNENASFKWKQITKLNNIISIYISTGISHTLCCDSEGMVYSFGCNEYGQLGIGSDDGNLNSTPIIIPFFSNNNIFVTDVCCGEEYSLVLTNSGTVYAFGGNYNGECGLGNTNETEICTPNLIQSLKNENIKGLKCGCNHSAVITQSNNIYMFGKNGCNQCIISHYDGEMHIPICINEYIQTKYKKEIVSIILGNRNTKLI